MQGKYPGTRREKQRENGRSWEGGRLDVRTCLSSLGGTGRVAESPSKNWQCDEIRAAAHVAAVQPGLTVTSASPILSEVASILSQDSQI